MFLTKSATVNEIQNGSGIFSFDLSWSEIQTLKHVIHKMRAANLSVYVGVLKNEFMNLGFDFWGNPMVEIVTYSSLMVDGIVTEFPGTVAEYFSEAGALPPAQGPAPVLEAADVVDPPLPPVTVGGHGAASPSNDSSTKSGATAASASAATQVRFPYVLNGDMITGQYFLSLITDVLDWRRLAVLLKLLKESDH
ncbi:hypothetical protein HU200_042792 [Digitaria exilis]|uniref:glycerophosphodiester phosphodiesterase n=1 Tax=Digitaria exilis TaxID=1010633 RepID=A0A835BFL8_9POAL|nr:hypothetical protein HU200_042792 [Digitaria exilis]